VKPKNAITQTSLLTLFIISVGVNIKSTTASELLVKVLSQGSGNVAEAGMTVTVHYTGNLTNGVMFDSSLDRKQPFVFTLGQGEVIQGWDQGINGMKVGEKRQLTIPPELGYGEAGAGSVIPPSATLIFEVELLAVSWHPKLIEATSAQILDAQKNDSIIVDIRRKEEWLETGVIEGAETITAFSKSGQLHPDFQSKFMALVTSLDTPVFLYCRTGNRTGIIGNALVDLVGLTNITHLEAGIVGWKKDGLPTVTYKPNLPRSVTIYPQSKVYRQLSAGLLRAEH